MKEEEERAKEEHQTEKDEAKRKREEEKAWETSREQRVGSWRDFVSGKKSKKSKKTAGGLKPPKQLAVDEDRAYIKRPVGEQYRPPPTRQ